MQRVFPPHATRLPVWSFLNGSSVFPDLQRHFCVHATIVVVVLFKANIVQSRLADSGLLHDKDVTPNWDGLEHAWNEHAATVEFRLRPEQTLILISVTRRP